MVTNIKLKHFNRIENTLLILIEFALLDRRAIKKG